MNPRQAVDALKELGAYQEYAFGRFGVVLPHGGIRSQRDLDLLVRAVKTLGSWSVAGLMGGRGEVGVETGRRPDELMFSLQGDLAV